MLPTLRETVALPSGVQAVETLDGIAYAATFGSIVSIDLLTGERLQTLQLGGELVDLAIEGGTLYATDRSNDLTVIDIAGFEMAQRGSVALLTGGGKLFVGNGIAYVAAASNSFRGGYVTTDVSDPDNPVVISGSDVTGTNAAPGAAIALNGSGLGLLVGNSGGVFTLDVMDVSDPEETNRFLTRVPLPANPAALALGAGIAFVADGSSGLQVVNYRSFDNQGQAPSVTITSAVADADPGSEGTQVVEGQTVPIQMTVTDDVQVRNVELLLNGEVVQSDVQFPFEFRVVAPAITSEVSTATVQVRATDTGGNTMLSNEITLGLVPDTAPPVVVGTTPELGRKVFFTPSIDIRFDEPLDESQIDIGAVSLTRLADDLVPDPVSIAIDTVDLRTLGRRLVVIPAGILDTGSYRLVLDAASISDRAGNALQDNFEFDFTVRPASDVQALSGTPAIDRAPSANTGQEIAFRLPGATGSEILTIQTISQNGTPGSRVLSPTQFDAEQEVLTYLLPADATTGDVLLEGDADGAFLLQVVPTLSDVVGSQGNDYHNRNLTLTGSGFAEGGLTVHFGGDSLVDPNTSGSVIDVFSSNTFVNLTVPEGVPFGPISVSTLGGTSESFGLEFDGIVSVADSGTAADASLPGANAGQAITLAGGGFDFTTDVVFSMMDVNGTPYERVVRPVAVSEDGTELTVVVPEEAVTGTVGIIGDRNNTEAFLQIVPTLTAIDLTSISFDGSTFSAGFQGQGFVEGGTTYTLGSESFVDDNVSPSGIDATTRVGIDNRFVRGAHLSALAFSEGIFGPITVTTAGGTSAVLSVGYTGIDAAAFSGTPADAGEASANPGQAVTVLGSGLNTGTDLVARYVDTNGDLLYEIIRPDSVNASGTEATVVVKDYYNGAFDLRVFGASHASLLQIVPVVISVDLRSNNFVQIDGGGFVEGDGAYTFSDQMIVDDNPSSSPIDVFGAGVHLSSLPPLGAGDLTVTTAGGTSAPATYNFINVNLGRLYAVASDLDTGDLLVINSSDARIHRIDSTTGVDLGVVANGLGISFGGLDVLDNAVSLNSTALPAGTLLVFNASTKDVHAIDPSDGTQLALLELSLLNPGSLIGGAYHAGRGSLFLLDGSPNQVIEIDPDTGLELNRFSASVSLSNGGIVVDPATGSLWVASDQANQLVELDPADGSVLQTIDLTSQSITFELSGLAFDAEGNLLASSTRGAVYQIQREEGLV